MKFETGSSPDLTVGEVYKILYVVYISIWLLTIKQNGCRKDRIRVCFRDVAR